MLICVCLCYVENTVLPEATVYGQMQACMTIKVSKKLNINQLLQISKSWCCVSPSWTKPEVQ